MIEIKVTDTIMNYAWRLVRDETFGEEGGDT